MKEMTLQELKNCSLNILKYLDQICRENDIRYSLGYGTLLGAVRHQGFIPWDDDVDIMLLRPEYERLISILKTKKEFKLLCFNDKYEYRYYFAKLCDPSTKVISFEKYGDDPEMGIYVDIFPIDGLPDTSEERKIFAEKAQQLAHKMELSMNKTYARSIIHSHAYAKRILKYPAHLKTKMEKNYFMRQREFNRYIQQYSVSTHQYCGLFDDIAGDHGVFHTAWFEHFEDIEFEGGDFQAISGYDDFLKAEYGNYMKFPPKEQQITHHAYTAYQL